MIRPDPVDDNEFDELDDGAYDELIELLNEKDEEEDDGKL